MHGLSTDTMQLSQDYLLFDDHREHHMGAGPSLSVESVSDLPQGYDPDLLLYDLRYTGGRTELAVPRHLIRFDGERKSPTGPTVTDTKSSTVHEELGFVLRQRSNTARNNEIAYLKESAQVPQVKVDDDTDDDALSLSTVGLQEATRTAAESAGDLMGRVVPSAAEAMHTVAHVTRRADSDMSSGSTIPFGSVKTETSVRSRQQTPPPQAQRP